MGAITTAVETTPHRGRSARLLARPPVLRLASSVVASLIAGIVVGGLGPRLVMRFIAMAADGSVHGLLTQNGARVGEITLEGTLFLVVFVGLASGLAAGPLLFALRTVLPRRRLMLWVCVVLLGLTASVVIDPTNPDFTILGREVLSVAMFLALFPAFGALAVWLASRFDRWLLAPSLVRLAPLTLIGTALATALGVFLLASPGVVAVFGVGLVIAVLGGLAAFARGGVAWVSKAVAFVVVAVGTGIGLVQLVRDVAVLID